MVEYVSEIRRKSHLNISQLANFLAIGRPKYYDWRKRTGLANRHNGKKPKRHWLTPAEKRAIIEYAREHMGSDYYYVQDGYRRIAYMGIDDNAFACSPSSVYRVLKKAGLLLRYNRRKSGAKGGGYKQPLEAHKQWHTDIKYVNYKGTFLFFISVMDGYSRYIVHHELRASMTEFDVETVLQRALEKYPDKRPKIITDNGSQYISKDFQSYLKEVGLQHVKTSPSYPQSNGKIERFHRSLQHECVSSASMINIEDAREQIARYVYHYNNRRLHSALYYLRPVDFLKGNIKELLRIRQEKIDKATERRSNYWINKNVAV